MDFAVNIPWQFYQLQPTFRIPFTLGYITSILLVMLPTRRVTKRQRFMFYVLIDAQAVQDSYE